MAGGREGVRWARGGEVLLGGYLSWVYDAIDVAREKASETSHRNFVASLEF